MGSRVRGLHRRSVRSGRRRVPVVHPDVPDLATGRRRAVVHRPFALQRRQVRRRGDGAAACDLELSAVRQRADRVLQARVDVRGDEAVRRGAQGVRDRDQELPQGGRCHARAAVAGAGAGQETLIFARDGSRIDGVLTGRGYADPQVHGTRITRITTNFTGRGSRLIT